MAHKKPSKTAGKGTAAEADQTTDAGQPLAPFNQAEPFELAVLAALLSGGKKPGQFLPAAASLWAQAYSYREELRWLYHGSVMHDKFKPLDLPAFAFGLNEQWLSLEDMQKAYPWSEKHWRQCLKEFLPPHIFKLLWKPPIEKMRIPKTVVDFVIKRQAEKRSNRSEHTVKSAKGV